MFCNQLCRIRRQRSKQRNQSRMPIKIFNNQPTIQLWLPRTTHRRRQWQTSPNRSGLGRLRTSELPAKWSCANKTSCGKCSGNSKSKRTRSTRVCRTRRRRSSGTMSLCRRSQSRSNPRRTPSIWSKTTGNGASLPTSKPKCRSKTSSQLTKTLPSSSNCRIITTTSRKRKKTRRRVSKKKTTQTKMKTKTSTPRPLETTELSNKRYIKLKATWRKLNFFRRRIENKCSTSSVRCNS